MRGLDDAGSGREEIADALLFGVGQHRSTEALALATGAAEASLDALGDHRALKFAKHAQHLKHGAAGRSAGIQPLDMQIKINTLGVHLAEERDEVLQASTKAIDTPARDHIELAPGNATAELIITWPSLASFGAAHAFVAILGDDAPAMPLGDRLELVALVFDGLPIRRRPQIESNAFVMCASVNSADDSVFSYGNRPFSVCLASIIQHRSKPHP